jgi:hypothetical protein
VLDTGTTITLLDACGRAGVTVLLTSDPGEGKSSMVRSLARNREMPCEVVFCPTKEPADFDGLPVPQGEDVSLCPPRWARNLEAAGKGILLLDELGSCSPEVQAAVLGVALERQVGDLRLPREVYVIAAANPPDKAANGWALAPPVANRVCHLEYQQPNNDYLDGLTTGWASSPATRAVDAGPERIAAQRAAVVGFLRKSPHLIRSYPKTAAEASGAWPSPRTWTFTADVLAHIRDDDDDARKAAVIGLVGDGAGIAFLEWLEAADLPDPEDVLANPAKVNWTDPRQDRVSAILFGVVAHCTAGGGSGQRWRQAWGPLVAAAQANAPDVAFPAARALARARPAGVVPPPAARAFGKALRQAGLDAPGQETDEAELEL